MRQNEMQVSYEDRRGPVNEAPRPCAICRVKTGMRHRYVAAELAALSTKGLGGDRRAPRRYVDRTR